MTLGEGPPARTAFERAFQRLAEGDRSAAPEVFAVLWPKLLRFCARAVATDAEDCAQRAVMKLFEEVSTFDSQRSPLAWAYAIAAWECCTNRRAQGRSREDAADPDTFAVLPNDLEDRDLVQRALALVASLSAADQRTFEAEMAEEGSSAAHRQRRHRMWERLRAAWRKVHGP